MEFTPHPPELCYKGIGFEQTASKPVEMSASSGHKATARLLTFHRQGQTVSVLYWYQLGEGAAPDRDGVRRLRWAFKGKPAWPPLIKVMLQSSASSPAQAESQLKELGELVLQWTRTISRPDDVPAG